MFEQTEAHRPRFVATRIIGGLYDGSSTKEFDVPVNPFEFRVNVYQLPMFGEIDLSAKF